MVRVGFLGDREQVSIFRFAAQIGIQQMSANIYLVRAVTCWIVFIGGQDFKQLGQF